MEKYICDICGEEIVKQLDELAGILTITLKGRIVKPFHTAAGFVTNDFLGSLHVHSKCFKKIRCLLSANSEHPETNE